MLNPLMRALLCLLTFMMISSEAQAALRVCNKSIRPARIAVGRFNGVDWMSEGWWPIEAGKCAVVVPKPLRARYYYLYASDGGTDGWGGSRAFCVGATDRFQIVGRSNCAGRGFDRKGFFAVDTGNQLDVTRSISD